MLCYVHQLVSNFVCLLFGAGQIVSSVSLFFFWFSAEKNPQKTKTRLIRAESQARKAKVMSQKRLKSCVELWETAAPSANSLWVHQYTLHSLLFHCLSEILISAALNAILECTFEVSHLSISILCFLILKLHYLSEGNVLFTPLHLYDSFIVVTWNSTQTQLNLV